jgi:hypothetical protein
MPPAQWTITLGASEEERQQWKQWARQAISIPIAAQSSATLCAKLLCALQFEKCD